MKHYTFVGIFAFCAAGLLFSQAAPKAALGMEPTPKNFDAAIASATARAGQSSIPPAVDLSAKFPKPGYQGEQQSCVAWATGYAVKSYHENLKNNWGLNSAATTFSPSFIYNQINNGQDAGSTIPDALELVKSQGSATLKTMPYGDYKQKPAAQARIEAAKYKAASYERLDGKNTNALKLLLAAGQPIVVGMKTYENFMTYSGGVYKKTSGAYLGGHAMVIVGYDDSKQAFKIMNSWSERWGEKGFSWYDYGLFAEMNHTAMVLYDNPSNTPAVSYPPNSLTASAGAYSDRIQVSWDAVQNAEYYIVFRADGSPDKFAKIAETKGTTFLDTAARPQVDYFYSVKSFGPGGESDFSSTVRGNLKSGQELGAPRNLKGTFASGKIRLIWDSVQGAAGYYVYRWDNAKEQWIRIGSSSDVGFEDAAVPSGSACERYVVTAYDRSAESKSDSAVAVSIPPPQRVPEPPAAPTSVKASQGTSRDKIDISWNKVAGADSYIVRKWSDRRKDWTELAKTRGTSYSDTGVQEKQAMYCVVAVQGTLTGEASAIAEGWLSGAPGKQQPKKNFADDKYREEFFTRADKFFGDDKFFSGDTFFTDASTFFDDFEEENFFFFDAEAFFKIDENFFGSDNGFFGKEKGGFFD
ncbi:MAG: C39 family peptidase [Spirochaetia bacterium]|jgi:fibronectin type 3 domain-containing protein|nr:C39 family peptidase [Spirochaetia bacterium]